MATDREGLTARARSAMEDGRHHDAHAALVEADRTVGLSSQALMLLGEVSYLTGSYEQAVEAFERAHARCVEDGDGAGAAAAAVQVATFLMMESGLMAPVRGWLRRARQYLEPLDEGPAHAWWEMTAAYECLMSGDLDGAGHHGQRAIDVGNSCGDLPAATMGTIVVSRVAALTGDLESGLSGLDEVALTILSGQLPPLPTGMAWCDLVCAMVGLGQYDRALEWTEAMERHRREAAVASIGGRCLVHRAETLRLRGECREAEDMLLRACDEVRPWMRSEYGWPLTELGMTRLRLGDLDGAEEAFVEAYELGWDPQPGLALLRLAQGDVKAAAESIRSALERPVPVPSKERPPGTDAWRAPLLAAQAQILTASGEFAGAEVAVRSLEDIAERFASQPMRASATSVRGRIHLARAEYEEAAQVLEEAVAAWARIGATWETAVARRWLAAAHRANGDVEQARLEFQTARSVFDRMGALLEVNEVRAAADASPSPVSSVAAGRGSLRQEGGSWIIHWAGQDAVFGDLRGLAHLAVILAAPRREFSAIALATADRGHPGGDAPDGVMSDHAGPIIDDQARRAYQRRLAEIQEELDQADEFHDPVRRERAALEKDFLERELSRAMGLGGRPRVAKSTSERARTSVTHAIRYAIDRVRERLPDLASHLDHSVRTGTWCSYEPDPALEEAWET